MTREQWNKHKEAIQWFMDQPEGTEIWCKYDKWYLTSTPSWSVTCEYIINDEYAEFRKAIAEGKTIQSRGCDGSGNWFDLGTTTHPCIFENKFDTYRIKPDEPQFKVGDWVMFKNNDCTYYKIAETTSDGRLRYEYVGGWGICSPSDIELWKPTEGELIVYRYNTGSYSIEPYRLIMNLTHVHPPVYDFSIYDA